MVAVRLLYSGTLISHGLTQRPKAHDVSTTSLSCRSGRVCSAPFCPFVPPPVTITLCMFPSLLFSCALFLTDSATKYPILSCRPWSSVDDQVCATHSLTLVT